MTEYENKCCTCCGERFKTDDDIVVCPECGTPMHRACWSGHCPNEARHAEGFDWDKAQENAAPQQNGGNALHCEICGFPIGAEEKLFCPECGSPMHKSCCERTGRCPHEGEHALGYDYHNAHRAAQSAPQIQPPFGSAMTVDEMLNSILTEPVKDSSGEEVTCYGVTQKELLHFLGLKSLSTPQFFARFMTMARTGKKISLNFFAGLFMPFYQFYRKMTGPAVVMTLAYLIMNIPQMLWYQMLIKNGIDAVIPTQLESIYSIMTYVGLAIEILLILFNDYIYMKWSVGKILSLREEYRNASEAEYMEALERAGRPRVALGFIALAAVGVITLVLMFFIGKSII